MKIKLFTNSGIFDRSVSLDGFTMTGFLTLSRNPMTGQEAATKRYVDNFPYNLSVDNITGAPVAIERFAPGITGDITMYNGNQTVLKSVAAAGSYGRVIVSAKGQVVSGMPPSSEAGAPTLMFSEITGRPTAVAGYAADPTAYIRNTAGVNNAAFTGALTLSRAPTTGTEMASYGYLTSKVTGVVAGYKTGEIVLKPNTVVQNGFLKANGGILSKTTYAALYAVVGDTYSPVVGGAGGYMGQPWRQQYVFNTAVNGTAQTWTTATSLPATVIYSQAIVTKDRVYLLGGYINGTSSSTVYTAPINADGTLGTWTTATSLPGIVTDSQAIVTKDRVYLLGGYINGTSSSTVYTAPINADGTLGTWTTATSLPATVYYSQAIVTKDRVYLLGGLINGADSSAVYTAPILADGTLGAWTTATSLPGTVGRSQAIVTKDRVYLLGGYISGAHSSTVYTAPFSGGVNDYLTLIANNTVNTTTLFKLPDTGLTDPAGTYSYIRAV